MASAFIVIPHPERERFGQSWDIIHAQSGATIQPYTGPLSRKLKKAEAEHIAKAQASRGADYGGRRKGIFALLRIVKRVRRILPIILPLFLASLRRAEKLILAMEARCYTGGKGRTHLVRFDSSWRDVIIPIAVLMLVGLLLYLNILKPDRQLLNWILSNEH